MIRKSMSAIGIAAIVLSSVCGGCSSPSVHSLSSPDSLVQDDGLAGEWATEGPIVTRVTVSNAPGDRYAGVLSVATSDELRTRLDIEISLTQIGDYRYVDLYLAQAERDRLAGHYGFLALPVHQFMKFDRHGDVLQVWTFNADWIRGAALQHAFACEIISLGGRDLPVITAESGSLHEYIEQHVHEPGALAPPMVFHRVRPASRQ